MYSYKVPILALLVCTQINAQGSSSNDCSQKTTCHDCIQTPSCAWCYASDFTGKRCFQPSVPDDETCPEEFTYNPDNIQHILLNKELSKAHATAGGGGSRGGFSYEEEYSERGWERHSGGSSAGGGGQSEIVQIKPQRLKLQLRPHQTYTVSMYYTQAQDYPVDLYYLMDLSKSMEDDKQKLSLLGNLLAESMQNITSNFRLGFGSFVDKVVMPYVSTVPQKLKQPCSNCEAPYGYRNHMALSTNTSRFSQMVRDAAVSGNLDAPEGGFDAIMQAIVCNREIGWREKARRLLVFSTDAGFHYAGDGKLGGIVRPNDGQCHLDSTGLYTHSSLLDYPSISQINLKVKENAINVIFAVTADQIGVYEQLKSHIEGSTSGQLSEDSSNIVELVRDQYQQISSSVEMRHEASSIIKVSYHSQCLDPKGPMKNTNKCGNIKVGDLINFQIDIEVLTCPKDPKQWNQMLKIYPVGVGVNESLLIDLELLCSCPCEHEGHPMYKVNSSECNYHGIYKCGVCECDATHIGPNCSCSATDNVHTTSDCRPSNTSTVDCSGRGECVCGQCICNNRDNLNETIYGKYCQCDNFSCDRHDGKICSGHGECKCGVCDCYPEWAGRNCACLLSTDTCIEPNGNGQICSGHGDCVCGSCHCNSPYTGPYCNKCATCTTRCEEFKECVQCQMYKTGKLSEEECLTNCTHILPPTSVDVVEAKDDNNEYLCTFYDEEDCRYSFVYYFDVKANKTAIRAEQNRECPAPVYVLGIVLGVIAAVVLIGLAILLLWKLFTTIHDRREFAKFEKERMMAKWDTGENPIYKQATSTFKNPTYAGKNL